MIKVIFQMIMALFPVSNDEYEDVYDPVNTPAAKAARREVFEQKQARFEVEQEIRRPIRSRLRDAFGRQDD